jgi:hypothetical protein
MPVWRSSESGTSTGALDGPEYALWRLFAGGGTAVMDVLIKVKVLQRVDIRHSARQAALSIGTSANPITCAGNCKDPIRTRV